jgi:uncharacterized RDD family membrane protein YckC
MNWYYLDEGKQSGPVDDDQLGGLVRAGKVQLDTLVWAEGMENWQPYGEVRPAAANGPGQSAAAPVTGDEAVCAECGQMFGKDSMIQHSGAWVCSRCKPVFLQKLSEGARINTGQLNYAGFWIRFGAKFIDGIILGVLIFVPMMLLIGFTALAEDSSTEMIIQGVFQLAYYVVSAGYTIFFVGKYGATPGKMACKLKIVDESGGKIGYGRATGRFFAEILSGLICYIGYIMAAFDDEKRSLHDRICNTRVVHK